MSISSISSRSAVVSLVAATSAEFRLLGLALKGKVADHLVGDRDLLLMVDRVKEGTESYLFIYLHGGGGG